MRALSEQGYDAPTPIQAQAIPLVKEGHDLLGIAQTGTGKTAAFALPTIDYLIREYRDPPKRGGRVLVLAPTRELAQQIAASFRDYGKYADLSVACIFGGASVRGQIKAVVGGNDVLVATPGRLLDLIDQKALRLSEIEVLILDEADQMMDMGFIHALKKIVPMLPKERQTLFFSATMPKKIKQLADQFLTAPHTVSVTPQATTAERVDQQVYRCGKTEKQALLITLLNAYDHDCALVFSRTKHGADRIVKKLSAAGITAGALHGNKSQGQRQRILGDFKSGKMKVLVATDIAARGIDIDGITHVINYDLPNQADQYVHRIGRTARAGRSGLAVSFCSPDENDYLKDIQKLIKQTLPVMPLPEDFNKKVAAVARMKPAPSESGTHTPRNDPRRNSKSSGGSSDERGGRDKKRRAGFKKKANAAQADIQSAITPEETGGRNARPQNAGRRAAPSRDAGRDEKRDVPEWKRQSTNPDGSRSQRKKRSESTKPKDRSEKRGDGPKGAASGKPFERKPRPSGAKSSGGKPSGGRPSGGKPSGERKDPSAGRSSDGRARPSRPQNRGGEAAPKRRSSRS